MPVATSKLMSLTEHLTFLMDIHAGISFWESWLGTQKTIDFPHQGSLEGRVDSE
jgi:hypothetical protein